MSARPVEWDGEVIAVVVEVDGESPYLVEPIVFDEDDNVVMGREVLAAVVESGTTVQHPVLRGYTPGRLAELEQRLARVRDTLGIGFGE